MTRANILMDYKIIGQKSNEELPRNFSLLNTGNIAKVLEQANQQLQIPPVNMCHSQLFCTAQYDALRGYLDILTEKRKLRPLITNACSDVSEFNKEVSAYFIKLSKKTPKKLQNSGLEAQFRGVLTEIANALFAFCPDHKVSLEIRIDKPARSPYIHIDRTDVPNQDIAEEQPFMGCGAKLILNLSNQGTAFFSHENSTINTNLDKLDQVIDNKLHQYQYFQRQRNDENLSAWYGKQLSLSIFPCAVWSHEPACHAKAIVAHSKKAYRSNAIFYIEP